ncbi:MAG: MEDS domain-containing protein [Pseudonocardiales bacterium]|nr:MEDS domain-containing protein [Pseudonocardiales bacterium]
MLGRQSGILSRVRRTGVIEDARGLGLHDHVCWAYDDLNDFRCRAREFLAEGLELGQQVWYVAPGDVETLADDLRDLDGMALALQVGAARVVSVESAYPAGTVVEPAAQAQAFVTAAMQARMLGFSGLRVAADTTPLVRTRGQLEAFARYECVVDRCIASHPLSGMCAYNRQELGEEVIAQLACLHPNINGSTAQFRLHASNHAAASLNGELDMTTVELLSLALQRADLQPDGGEVVIDAAGLTFIDHRALLMLADRTRRTHATVVLQTDWPGAAPLVECLDIKEVRVEPPGWR